MNNTKGVGKIKRKEQGKKIKDLMSHPSKKWRCTLQRRPITRLWLRNVTVDGNTIINSRENLVSGEFHDKNNQ